MDGRRVNTLDEHRILQEAAERATKLLERAGIRIATRWPVE